MSNNLFQNALTLVSMGGHGALISFLKNPGKYRSVSAFAPIVNPVSCPWGQNAFTGYLGSDKEKWNVRTFKETIQYLFC